MKIFNDYEIDENGNVYSYKSNKYLTPHLDRYGYLYVTINSKHYKVHRLVAEAFIPNPNKYSVVNHIDGNKTNNFYLNLEKYNNLFDQCEYPSLTAKIQDNKNPKNAEIKIRMFKTKGKYFLILMLILF